MADTLGYLIYFVAFAYWPLLFLRLREHFSGSRISTQGIIASLIIGAAAGYAVSVFNYFSYATPIMLAVALAPVVLMFFISPKTKIKMLALAAYLHAFWQLLPALDGKLLVVEIVLLAAAIALAKFLPSHRSLRKRGQKSEHSGKSISELWS